MTDTEFAIPADLHEFDVALGRSEYKELTVIGLDLPDEVVDKIPLHLFISRAQQWREIRKYQLQRLARIAAHAQRKDTDGRHTFFSMLDWNMDGIGDFISSSNPSYLRRLVESGRGRLEGKELEEFFKLLQLLPPE